MAYKRTSPMPVEEGGTAAITLTDHAVIIGSGVGAVSFVGPVASSNNVLMSNGVGSDPGFSTATYPVTTTANEILYSSATNTVSELTTANSGVLTTGATGVPAITAIATDGQFIIGATAGAPAAGTITSTGATITVTPGANTINLEAAGGSGDVSGPGSSTDRAIATWNGTGGDTLYNNSTITISSAGEMVNTAQPAFLAYVDTAINNVTGNGTVYTIIFDTEAYDQNADFNLGTSTFTAPVTGKYLFNLQVVTSGGSNMTGAAARVTTSNRTLISYGHTLIGATVNSMQNLSALMDMDSADTATFQITTNDSGGKIDDIAGTGGGLTQTFVSGNLSC